MAARESGTGRGGRHRPGTPVAQVQPGRWDPAKRAAARQLDQLEPAWVVWYGVGARCFYAVAIWGTPGPLLVQSRTIEELRALMREADSSGRTAAASSPSSPHTPHPPRGANMPDSTPDPRVVHWELPHDLSMAGKARGMVHETLLSWGLQELADDVILATGELVANALAYGAPPVRLALSARGDDLRLEVTDHGSGHPRRLDLGVEAVHGRGLAIVEALAAECGVTTRPDVVGKTVWARWRVPSRSAPPDQDTGRCADEPTGIGYEPST
ncbi:hypothetical protein Sme01_11080 [Sphaerisporangium melleum]|uniref:Histidine kinase/HSP90-like ATPase domain-containing protein n=1 Tax=Sphaerisporangium melleum TaxID=321316 RepID=A0A917QSS9_9ACTN|nr:ATP-binding protein [Sphaerisporangium melleum]GGK66172.1 hypothetical protein GCM10007964_06540 [Sphaerisporangium melleum]GII68632.1 hypothetical protein Sme01_11080 [Sphaerisporangium melleum]